MYPNPSTNKLPNPVKAYPDTFEMASGPAKTVATVSQASDTGTLSATAKNTATAPEVKVSNSTEKAYQAYLASLDSLILII